MTYAYGMRLRGFSLGCQPMKGFIERQDDTTGRYHDILIYDRELTEKELKDYELDSLKEKEETIMTAQDRINALFEELVPSSGAADTVAGEIIRATCRIGYRWTNDGDQLGIGYGKETCNPAGRYLGKTCNDDISKQIWSLMYDPIYDDSYDGAYQKALEKVYEAILDYLEQNPELKTTKNEDDFWNHRDKDEDVDDSWDEEEDEYF